MPFPYMYLLMVKSAWVHYRLVITEIFRSVIQSRLEAPMQNEGALLRKQWVKEDSSDDKCGY